MLKRKYLIFIISMLLIFILLLLYPYKGILKKNTAESEIENFDYNKQTKWNFESGKMQSPVNIDTKQTKNITPDSGLIKFNDTGFIRNVKNTGLNIKAESYGVANINGRTFELEQLHFHYPSEHTSNGKHFPMEAHFVNKAKDGRVAVIAVFFEVGSENSNFEEILQNIDQSDIDLVTKPYEMIPENHSYYHYLGSLTTPPLSENVEWYIMRDFIEISDSQLKYYTKMYSPNNRNIQPLNGREVLEYIE